MAQASFEPNPGPLDPESYALPLRHTGWGDFNIQSFFKHVQYIFVVYGCTIQAGCVLAHAAQTNPRFPRGAAW